MCDHSNESSQWVLSNGAVHIVLLDSSCFFANKRLKKHVEFGEKTAMSTKSQHTELN